MDLCIPTFKAANGADFDGHSGEYDKYLARERPVGWREEQRKLDYMSNSVDDGAEKFIKIRMINRDTIVASQVRQLVRYFKILHFCLLQSFSFNTSTALMGMKLQVYVLLKLLKYLRGSSVKRFKSI